MQATTAYGASSILWLTCSSLAAPLGAPDGTYNASQTDSGAYTQTTGNPIYPTDYASTTPQLYYNQPAWFSYFNGPGSNGIITWHKIDVPVESSLFSIVGHGYANSSLSISNSNFFLTVDPTLEGAAAAPNSGSVFDAELILANTEPTNDNGMPGPFLVSHQVNLLPADTHVLQPGTYWISVTNVVGGLWFWSDLSIDPNTSETSHTWFFGDPYGTTYPVRGRSPFGNGKYILPTGVAAIDIWMSPTSQPCPADLAKPYGILDLSDIGAFTAAFVAHDPAVDSDNNGIWDLSDISEFIESFLAGCP